MNTSPLPARRRVLLVAWFLREDRRWLATYLDPARYDVEMVGTQLPVRFETFIRATGETARLEYWNWAPMRLPDEFFASPSGADGWKITTVESYEAWLSANRSERFRQVPIILPVLLHGRPR